MDPISQAFLEARRSEFEREVRELNEQVARRTQAAIDQYVGMPLTKVTIDQLKAHLDGILRHLGYLTRFEEIADFEWNVRTDLGRGGAQMVSVNLKPKTDRAREWLQDLIDRGLWKEKL